MAKGWIKLHRQIADNPIWFDSEPFDRRSAWIDLLLQANHERRQFLSNGQMLTLEPGQLITSIPILAKRWKWSPNKVRRFLRLLDGSAMSHTDGSARGTLITIVNWGKFQGEGHTDGRGDGSTDGSTDGRGDGRGDGRADGTLTRMLKNDKNERSVCTHAPDLSEIETYCSENGIETDIRKFWQYNEGTGWRMDWKTALWMWIEKDKQKSRETKAGSFGDFEQRSYDFDEIEKQLIQGGGAS